MYVYHSLFLHQIDSNNSVGMSRGIGKVPLPPHVRTNDIIGLLS